MVVQNLNFYDKFGIPYNFSWDSTTSMWVGSEYIQPISVALFDNINVFLLEKVGSSYSIPQLGPTESITLSWTDSQNSQEFFLYSVVFDTSTNTPYINPLSSQTLEYSDFPLSNPSNAPAIGAAKLTITSTTNTMTWRAVPGLQYSYNLVAGGTPDHGTSLAEGNVTLNASSLNVGALYAYVTGSTYTVTLSVTYLNSAVNAVYFTFVAGTPAVISGAIDPNFVTQPGQLNSSSVMQFNVAFTPSQEVGYTRVLNAYYNRSNGSTVQFLQMTFYGEGVEEDERFTIWLNNFGIKFNRTDALLLQNYDLTEGLPDWTQINEKRKELLVNKEDIFPYVGTYKGLINFIDIMGYAETLFVKEYWVNQNTKSENYGKYAQLDVTDLINPNTVGTITDLVTLNRQIKMGGQFRKTNMLALVYQFNETNGDFDAAGIPIVVPTTNFTPDQIFFKLNGLAKKLKNEFLPVNVIIKDIIGEFLYFDKITMRQWLDRTYIWNPQIGTEFGITVNSPSEQSVPLQVLDIKSLYIQGPAGFPTVTFNTSNTNPYDNAQKYNLTDLPNWISAVESFYSSRLALQYSTLGAQPDWEYSDEPSAPIGCPIILGIDNESPTIADLVGSSISDCGANNFTVGNINYLNFYEIEWTITGMTTANPYSFNWRGPITVLNTLPHILPYTGQYAVNVKLHDMFAGASVHTLVINVQPQTPVVLGVMRLEDKFNYSIQNLANTMVQDFAGSCVFNPMTIVLGNENTLGDFSQASIDQTYTDWATYSLNYGMGTSQYNIEILSEAGVWENYFASTHPMQPYWGTARNQQVATVNDYQNATVGDMFHSRLTAFAWQRDFQNGFYFGTATIVPGTTKLTIGEFAPYVIQSFSSLQDLANQLNSSGAPGISNFTYSVVGNQIHADAIIHSKLMHQEWAIE